MKMTTLQELYVEELKDIYSAENQLLKALPQMAKAASSEDLRMAFKDHLKETEAHVERLEKIFKSLDKRPTGKKCKGMEGLLAEGQEMISENADAEVKDAGLISAAQRVEHYEIAAYGCVRTYASLLGDDEAVDLLQTTLNEEGACDKLLTTLSERINIDATDDDEDEEMETSSTRGKASGRSSRAKAR